MLPPTAKIQPPGRSLPVPVAPVLVVEGQACFCLTTEGELKRLTLAAAAALAQDSMPLVCHAPHVAAQLGLRPFRAWDVLELLAFVHPGRTCAPSPRGLARALHLMEPAGGEEACVTLRDAVRHLFLALTAPGREERSDPAALAALMGSGSNGWPWMAPVLEVLGRSATPPSPLDIRRAAAVWERLPRYARIAPERADPPHQAITREETATRLRQLLQRGAVEKRIPQEDYAAAMSGLFSEDDGETRAVLLEAGTGVGKTLGYLAPATVWAEKNASPVWISTFTRNLQRQVERELERLYGDAETRARHVVVRKGRENYLCLLNLEDAARTAEVGAATSTVGLGLMLRWTAATADGDLTGADFPGWLAGLIGGGKVPALADRRGECVYSACPHFDRCFVEKSQRRARRAAIVIANHALTLREACRNDPGAGGADYYIFDEGHHIFDAAESAFSVVLNGTETAELRRWLLGQEGGGKSRARGLKRRLEDVVEHDDVAKQHLQRATEAAHALPGVLWRHRLAEGAPRGAVETFLAAVRADVTARTQDADPAYSLEAPSAGCGPALAEAARACIPRLNDIARPLAALAAFCAAERARADTTDDERKERLDFLAQSLRLRADTVTAWIEMLGRCAGGAGPEDAVDWLEIVRIEGREHDVGLTRAPADPAQLFAERLKAQARGAAFTSATLRDPSAEDESGWAAATARTGLTHFSAAPRLFHVPSPFDYPARTRVMIVGDVRKDDPRAVAAAYARLFQAAGGGALGLFTAVQRLKAAHAQMKQPMSDAGLPLYAQHVDALNTATLIDMFREEENACLLGTDATRDGIDVPGRALRLVVYDRVPWPRPTLLHRARRTAFGRGYDDTLTRGRLKQAYGRLIRRADDRGVFVMLDGALPSRLLTAFPPGVVPERVGLDDAVRLTREFLGG